MELKCGLEHMYCAQCFDNLIKITRIKKGLTHRLVYADAIKCPQCTEIVFMDEAIEKEIDFINESENVKTAIKSTKMAGLKVESAIVSGKYVDKAVCQMCLQSSTKNPR